MPLSIKGSVRGGRLLLFLLVLCLILLSPAFLSQTNGQTEINDLKKGQDLGRGEDKGDAGDGISTLLQLKNLLSLAVLIVTVSTAVLGILILFIRIGLGPVVYQGIYHGTSEGIERCISEQKGTKPLFSDQAVREGVEKGLAAMANSFAKNESVKDFCNQFLEKITEYNNSLRLILEKMSVGGRVPDPRVPKRTYGYGIEHIIEEINDDFKGHYEELAEILKYDLNKGEQVAIRLLKERYTKPDKKRAIIILELANIYHEFKSEEQIEKGLAILHQAEGFHLKDNRVLGLIHFLQATLSRDNREFSDALRHTEKAKQLFPANPHVLKELAYLYWFLDDRDGQGTRRIDQVIDITRQALQVAKRDSFISLKILNNLCYFLSMRVDMSDKLETQKREDIKEALDISETFRQMEVTKRAWLDTRGYCYLVAHRILGKKYYLTEARKVLEQARELEPSNPWTLEHLAQVTKRFQSLK